MTPSKLNKNIQKIIKFYKKFQEFNFGYLYNKATKELMSVYTHERTFYASWRANLCKIGI